MPLGSNDFELIEGTGWDGTELVSLHVQGVIHGRLDYGDDFDWDAGHLSYCECGNVKQDSAERCYECYNQGRLRRAEENPYAIRQRPKKDWDPIEYIRMIQAEIQDRKVAEH